MSRLLALLLALTALTFGLAACGDDDESTSGDSGATATETTPAASPTTAATTETTAAKGGDDDTGVVVTGAENLDEKPQIEITAETQADKLIKKDLVVGDGKTAKEGDTVSVQYVGVGFNSEEEFDASWNRGEPFAFTLGAGEVIPGWDEGVAGMKEGGRRLLVIPGDKAYGAQGSPPAIGPDETLAFVVDLEKVS
ncbi:FKBP-type peptidyl-prolyl cis-trans isomerase [Svornostia abyssi]|uniref:Peptidyl-prolyl cis-trans isomerase n=1 Tax=Svornostia abyssi TaxID=2898438 RepID=A0ABY5PFZ9_9ACTN|nr:FKBP-type peptidyl-prolyl cis-trans isomerase [Parviterribacteraceae bacterium J379]